jgi:hypothetical protein
MHPKTFMWHYVNINDLDLHMIYMPCIQLLTLTHISLNLLLPSLTTSFLSPTHLHGYKKANELVLFHVRIVYIEIIKIIFLFQTYLLQPFLLHIYMEMKDLA